MNREGLVFDLDVKDTYFFCFAHTKTAKTESQ